MPSSSFAPHALHLAGPAGAWHLRGTLTEPPGRVVLEVSRAAARRVAHLDGSEVVVDGRPGRVAVHVRSHPRIVVTWR